MRCFKCKKEIADNILRCNYCNTKVQAVCPVCKTANPITSEYCSRCGLQLLKYCPECNAVNLPDAKECRKCHAEFEIEAGAITLSDIENSDIEVKKVDEVEVVVENQPCELELIAKEVADNKSPLEELTAAAQSGPLQAVSGVDLSGLSLSHEQILEQKSQDSFADLLALADDSQDLLTESLEKEDITPEPVINADAVQTDVLDIELPDENNVEEIESLDIEKTSANDEQEPQEVQEIIEPEDLSSIEIEAHDQMKCKNMIVRSIKDPSKKIIGFSAPEGYGKSTVLRYLFDDLKNDNIAWFWGECSANSQISPYGIFQEMILTFFNMPNFSNMSEEFITQAKGMLSATLPFFSQQEIFNLFNFLYPTLTSNYEDILLNKDTTFTMLEKLLLELSKKLKLVIVIDDFDMIDGASYAFLSYFVEQGNLGENIKLVITYKDDRITQGYFYSEKLLSQEYADVKLAKLTESDADSLVKMFFNRVNPLPEALFETLYEYSKGNSAYFEQMLILLNEYKAFYTEDNTIKYKQTKIEGNLPKNLSEILSLRIKYLQKQFPICYRTLCTAAIMGNKFNVKLLEIIMKLKSDEFQNVIKLLSNYAYITPFNNNIYEFKNTLLWKFVYEQAKQNKDFCMLNEKIFDVINTFTLSSNALKALIAQSLNQKLLALNIWTENTKLCSYLGDEHLWTLSQKQCLKIAGEITPDNNEVIVNNIQERLGKLLYESRPSEAIPFLSNAISNALKVGNRPKIIELSGYLSRSCTLTGNYNGVIEAVDTVLSIIESPDNKLATALVKYKKLKAMFSIGNAEEIYNLASNEIIPVVEQALSEVIPTNGISMEVIYETWLECNLTVAMALISQGSSKCFSVLKVIDEIVEKNNVTNKNYLHRLQLAKALAYSITGRIKESDDVLITFSQQTAKEIIEPDVISMWNFINILNKLFKKEWTNIKEDLYSVVTFANNYNDVLVKNMLKIFLGKVLQEEGNLSKAMEIYNEQVAIFAREKIAIGALLCWYFIAKLSLVTEGSDKALDIAQKALDVAKNPKISNYYFMVLYKKLIAEIYLIKGDMEASKMYIEKALMIVKQYDLQLLKVSLYQLYAKYLEEMVSKKPQNKANYAQNAIATYKKASGMVEPMNLPNIQAEINKDFASFKAFCQLNDIKAG